MVSTRQRPGGTRAPVSARRTATLSPTRSALRGVDHGLDEPGKARLELVAAQPDELPRPGLALRRDPGFRERLEVVARRRLRHRQLDLLARELAFGAADRELTDDREPDRI